MPHISKRNFHITVILQVLKRSVNVQALIISLQACCISKDLEQGKTLHQHAVRTHLNADVKVTNSLINMYSKCGNMSMARQLFEELPVPTIVSWTTLIVGYAVNGSSQLALDVFANMEVCGCFPERLAYIAAIMALANAGEKEDTLVGKLSWLAKGMAMHNKAIQHGYDCHIILESSLIDMYAKCGSIVDARTVFDRMKFHDIVSWTSLVQGYVETGEPELALELYESMQDYCQPNTRTFIVASMACARLADKEEATLADGKMVKIESLKRGILIHSHASKRRCESDVFVANTLVDMYSRCRSLTRARDVFKRISQPTVVSWNNLIRGLAEYGDAGLALEEFARMQREGCEPNHRTYIAVLLACGNLVALETGRRLHREISDRKLETELILANCILDFYVKCGSMSDAERVFSSMSSKSPFTWSSLMAGYGRQGDAGTVFRLFQRMQDEGFQPNNVTFISVLAACSYTGLVSEGRDYFNLMVTKFGITPEIEHYHCLVDLLGRANKLAEAVELVNSMPYKATAVTWKTVLGACRKWKNVTVGKMAFDALLGLNCRQAGVYLLMGGIYGSLGMWSEQASLLRCMVTSRLSKEPGLSSWTDEHGKVHSFRAGDRSHPQREAIYTKLTEVMLKLKEAGYVAELGSVASNITDVEKEVWLCEHSERLAISCALINTPPGAPIRIVKNLRVCDDCHRATAAMSKTEKRVFICRDANRFHVFQDGECSCGNFW